MCPAFQKTQHLKPQHTPLPWSAACVGRPTRDRSASLAVPVFFGVVGFLLAPLYQPKRGSPQSRCICWAIWGFFRRSGRTTAAPCPWCRPLWLHTGLSSLEAHGLPVARRQCGHGSSKDVDCQFCFVFGSGALVPLKISWAFCCDLQNDWFGRKTLRALKT